MWLIKASLKNPYMVATLVFMILVLGADLACQYPASTSCRSSRRRPCRS